MKICSRKRPVVEAKFTLSARSMAVHAVVDNFRQIPLSYSRHIRGFHPVRDGHESIGFESLLERDTITWLASFPEVRRIQSQPLTVLFQLGSENHRYTPDLKVEIDGEIPFELECLGFGAVTLIECKPAWVVPNIALELDRNARAVRLAKKSQLLLITEHDLRQYAKEGRYGQ